jgi:outer membrane lipoprotein-sorting protein
MDAKPLLDAVAAAYAKLRSLEVEIRHEQESGDEESFQRSASKSHGWYAAPNLMRYENRQRHGALIVTDGEQIHYEHRTPAGPRSSSHNQYGNPMPCEFHPDAPWCGDTVFVFHRNETWGTNTWEDGAFVNTFKLRARNMDLQFERRLTFEEGALKVVEKITGPRGVTEREYTI